MVGPSAGDCTVLTVEKEFEEAARLRDEIRRLEATELGLDRPGISRKVKWEPKGKQKKKNRRM